MRTNCHGCESEEMEELRELHYEQLHKMHFSQNIIRMVKCRRMKREGCLVVMWEERNCYVNLAGKCEMKSSPWIPIFYKRR
jgi:hypothetical protein